MATTIGLGVQFTANASGMTKGLSEVDRQLKKLGQQASGVASLFDQFSSSSSAAASAQRQVATDLGFLNSAYRTGQISAEQYAAELKTIVNDATAAAAAFAEGARITEQQATAEERRAAKLERLAQLLQLGALNQQAYDRAAADASGANERAAKAEEERARFLARAAQITQANLSPQRLYDQDVQELNQHLRAGTITQEVYNSALQKAQQKFDGATAAAKKYDAAADAAGTGNNLAFSQVSGLLAGLPGPIGSVAGRLSGLTSAAEGLNGVFAKAGGGLGSFTTQLTALANPATLAIAGVAALGGAIVAVGKGLVSLANEVERLDQLATRVGVSFEFIQVLDAAARNTGGSVEQLGGAFNRFLRTLDEARNGSKTAVEGFARLGLSAEDLRNKTPEQLFRELAGSISGIEDPAERAAISMQLFGKAGTELLPVFASLDQAADDLERIGGALTERQRDQIKGFDDELDRAAIAARGFGNQVLAAFADSATNVVQGGNVILSTLSRTSAALGDAGQVAATAVVNQIPGLNVLAFLGNLGESLGLVGTRAREAAAAIESISVDDAALGGQRFYEIMDRAVTRAAEAGQAGLDAAQVLQRQLDEIADLEAGGDLTSEQATRGGQQAQAEFERTLSRIEAEQKAKKDAAKEDSKRADEADAKRKSQAERDLQLAQSVLDAQLSAEERRATQAQRNLEELGAAEFRARQEAAAAAEAGNREAEAAALRKVDFISQAAQSEREVLDGTAAARQKHEEETAKAVEERQKAEEDRQRRIGELSKQYAERAADIERDRLDALSRRSNEALQGNDIRTSAGISQFLALATGREDPAIEEARKQNQELQAIRRELQQARAQPADILG